MAKPVYYTGDTWPPLSGTVKDVEGGAVDISTADSLRMVAKRDGGADVIAGTAVNLDDGQVANRGQWEYVWAAADLSIAGDWTPEIEVTWNSAATPPQIETCLTDTEKFTVKADND